MEGVEWDMLHEVCMGVWDRKSEESVVKAMKELETLKDKILQSLEWAQQDRLWRFCNQIYVLLIPDLPRRIIKQHHDSKIAGHAGHQKTLELILCNYWWPNMSRYISQYCKACDMCLCTKAQK